MDGLAWSQDGRQLLLAWRDADQWLLLGPGGRVRPLHGRDPRARHGGRLPARRRLVLRRASAAPAFWTSTTCWKVGRLIQWISGWLIAPTGRWRTAS